MLGVEYILSDLDFFNGTSIKTISGVTFDRLGSDIDEFFGDTASGQPPASAFFEPLLSFDCNSFTASFSSFDSGLVADEPRLRYQLRLGSVDSSESTRGPPIAAGSSGLLIPIHYARLRVWRIRLQISKNPWAMFLCPRMRFGT